MGLKADIIELENRSKREYSEYKEKLGEMMRAYDDCRRKFDVLIGPINSERLSFRDEIGGLYNFLQSIGGKLKEEKRISVFKFTEEALAPNQLYTEIPPLPEPTFKNSGDLNLLRKGLLLMSIDHFSDKETYENFLVEVEKKKNEYDKDINDRRRQIEHMEAAIKIAEIYRNIVVTVKDTIKEKILPELNLIQAFLYADAIRELVLDGEKPEYVEPCAISEYKGTKQDVHYQFVRNAFDFYTISTSFFTRTVLTDILSDRVVSETEKEEFEQQINEIKQHIIAIESKKVI